MSEAPKIALGIGYPLGVQEVNGKTLYSVGLHDGHVALNKDEFVLWIRLFPPLSDDVREQALLIDRLVQIGVAIIAYDYDGILTKLLKYRVFRQGIGMLKDGDNYVYIGEKGLSLSKNQMDIWRSSNGVVSIAQIYETCFKKEEMSSLDKERLLMEDILFLMREMLIIII